MGLDAPKKTVASAPGKDLPSSSPPAPSFFSPSSPAQNVQAVADKAAAAITFFADRFGDYPYSSLALTQSPGPVSQGWPGLVFLSGYAFLSPAELASHNLRRPIQFSRARLRHTRRRTSGGEILFYGTLTATVDLGGVGKLLCAIGAGRKGILHPSSLVMEAYRDDLFAVQRRSPHVGSRRRNAGTALELVALSQRL